MYADNLYLDLVSEYLDKAVTKFKQGAKTIQSLIKNVDVTK